MQITLKHPIEMKSKATGEVIERIEQLTLRPLRTGDFMAALDVAGADMKCVGSLLTVLASRSSGLTKAQFEGLELDDGFALIEAVQDFLPAGLLTGSIASSLSSAPSASPPGSPTGDPAS